MGREGNHENGGNIDAPPPPGDATGPSSCVIYVSLVYVGRIVQMVGG